MKLGQFGRMGVNGMELGVVIGMGLIVRKFLIVLVLIVLLVFVVCSGKDEFDEFVLNDIFFEVFFNEGFVLWV